MAHSLQPVSITPIQSNICQKCLEKARRGSKIAYFHEGSCECTFPVPNAKTWFDEKLDIPAVAYSQDQKRLDLEFLEEYETLTCTVALAHGLIDGFQMQAQERRIARMREKCKGMALAAMSYGQARKAGVKP